MNINYQRFEATVEGWQLCNGNANELWKFLQKLEEQENRLSRQGAKTMTEDQIKEILMLHRYQSLSGIWIIEEAFDSVAQSICAALPPDQSARIAELEAHIANHYTGAATKYIKELEKALEECKGFAELSTDVRDILRLHELLESIIHTANTALSRIKAGQS